MNGNDVQIACAVVTLLAVLLGLAVQWGSQRAITKGLTDRVKFQEDAHDRKFGEVWSTVNEHEGRIGYLEGKTNGRASLRT